MDIVLVETSLDVENHIKHLANNNVSDIPTIMREYKFSKQLVKIYLAQIEVRNCWKFYARKLLLLYHVLQQSEITTDSPFTKDVILVYESSNIRTTFEKCNLLDDIMHIIWNNLPPYTDEHLINIINKLDDTINKKIFARSTFGDQVRLLTNLHRIIEKYIPDEKYLECYSLYVEIFRTKVFMDDISTEDLYKLMTKLGFERNLEQFTDYDEPDKIIWHNDEE